MKKYKYYVDSKTIDQSLVVHVAIPSDVELDQLKLFEGTTYVDVDDNPLFTGNVYRLRFAKPKRTFKTVKVLETVETKSWFSELFD